MSKEEKINEILNYLKLKLNQYSLSELNGLLIDDDFIGGIEEVFDFFSSPRETLIMNKLSDIDNDYEIGNLIDFLKSFSLYHVISKEELLSFDKNIWKIWLNKNRITSEEFDQIIQFLINRNNKYWIEINELLENKIEEKEEIKVCINLSNYCQDKGQIEYLEEVPF